tara:strand:- start:84 stop:1247 length:1164 start_codon:yes stop_codon:yes gene_type:complete
MKRIISIIGSTGSIGLSSLNIIQKNKNFQINLLSANKNYRLILKQIKIYKPKYFLIRDHSVFLKVKKIKYRNTKIVNSFESINLIKKNDITICAIPGIAGLEPTIKLIKFSKKLFIANKESVVIGWNIISKTARKYNTKIVPLDSEHFAISKLLSKHKISDIKKIYITASGGPFLNYSINDLKKIKPEDALKHPKWKMGKKISIDSSTLMNKILELVEAQKLFNIPKDKIDIIIHPNSLVHAFVELHNGISEFIYHETSMIIPIANAIYDGNLKIEDFYKKKKIFQEKKLIFQNVNQKIFPIIKLKNLINKYPSTPIIVNASNEILVEQFLNRKIPFLGISKIIMSVLRDRNYKKNAIIIPKNLNQVTKLDKWAKQITFSKIDKLYG